MLVLTRKRGEKIVIGDNIVIEILEIKGSSTRLGITAPSHIPVVREEIWIEDGPTDDGAQPGSEEQG